jgi:hypothetical protein
MQAIATDLREKLGWLVTPKSDTAEHLARAIGEVLIVAVTGDLDRLLGHQTTVATAARFRLRDQLIAFARWALIAVGPGLAVLVAWPAITDPATRTLFVQIAGVCFLNATFSAIAGGGDERLNNIAKIGSGIFGWGRPKGE